MLQHVYRLQVNYDKRARIANEHGLRLILQEPSLLGNWGSHRDLYYKGGGAGGGGGGGGQSTGLWAVHAALLHSSSASQQGAGASDGFCQGAPPSASSAHILAVAASMFTIPDIRRVFL